MLCKKSEFTKNLKQKTDVFLMALFNCTMPEIFLLSFLKQATGKMSSTHLLVDSLIRSQGTCLSCSPGTSRGRVRGN